MPLPKGFNPATMKFDTVKPAIEIPRNFSVNSNRSYSPNLWKRFDSLIGSIGNWFVDSSEGITSTLGILLLTGMAIPFIGWLISLGWFWGIVAGFFLGGIAYYAAIIIVGIFSWICTIILLIIRYIFYSGTSFLITLAIVGVITTYGHFANSNSSIKYAPTVESAVPLTRKYYCTARTLNIRSMPNTNASIIGSLKHNQVVDVYETTNGFAKIKYGSKYGFVSLQYLKEQY